MKVHRQFPFFLPTAVIKKKKKKLFFQITHHTLQLAGLQAASLPQVRAPHDVQLSDVGGAGEGGSRAEAVEELTAGLRLHHIHRTKHRTPSNLI